MELLMFESSENDPISGPNNIKGVKLRKAARDGFLGLPAQIDAQKEEAINSLFGGNDHEEALFNKD